MQKITAHHLSFSLSANATLPDQVWRVGQAHCLGYAALMSAILQEIIKQKGAATDYQIDHIRAD